ncbi:MAG: hypothetical protein QME12_08920, partial [Nanoarchaeota archaeon]|nr:hypothetical protein [Nanoarchaeota archaeon]
RTLASDLREVPRTPASDLLDLNMQYSQLTALETTICSKLPIAMLNRLMLPSCSDEPSSGFVLSAFQCGLGGAAKCVNGRCEVDKKDVCPVGVFGELTPASSGAAEGRDETTGGADALACNVNRDCVSWYCKSTSATEKHCAACVANSQCPGGRFCSDGFCVLTPQTNNMACLMSTDCRSGYCAASKCNACSIDGQCAIGNKCENGVCKFGNGQPCGIANHCKSGTCRFTAAGATVSGVCI